MRHTGIHIIGDVPWGTHFCQFYQDKQDLIDILVPYFKAGLENNEFCMWVTSEPLRTEEAKAALASKVGDLGYYVRKGQIEFLDYSQWYTAGGRFESDPVLQGWVTKLEAAKARGFDGLRLTGNTFWLEKSDWRDFTEYEATVDGVIGQYRMLAVCTYSLFKCGAAEIMDVVSNHAFALIKRAGEWQVIENAERKRIEDSLRESEERYASLFEQMTEGFALHEIICDEKGLPCDYRFLEINPAFEQLTGLKRDDVAGKTMRQVLPNDDPKWIKIYGEVALTGKAVHFDNYSPELKRNYDVLAYRPAPGQFAVLFTDVTERKQAEEQIRELNADLERRVSDRTAELRAAFRYARSLIEASPDPLVTISPEGRVTDVNEATELVTGVPRERLIGSNFSEYFTEPEKAEAGYHQVLSEGLVRDYPLTIRHVSGRTTDVLYNATVYRNEAGQVQGVFAAARDVTERKRMEEKLRATNETLQRLAAIVECSEDAIIGKSLDGVITSWNQGAERIYGYAASEIVGKLMDLLVSPDHPTEVPQILKQIRHGKQLEHSETTRIKKDGGCLTVSLTVSPIKDAAGRIIGASAIERDITERKRMEEELRTASLYARSLIEASLDPLVTISPYGKITDVNRATELATGVSRRELIGSDFSHYFTEPQKADDGYRKVIAEGLVRDYPLTLRHVSGHTINVVYNASVYRNRLGEVQGVFAAARDITVRKRMEEDLRAASLYARSLIEASLDPLVTISPEGRVTDVNEATELVTGVPRERLIGSNFSEYFTEPEKAEAGYHQVLSEGLVRDYPLTIRHVSGRTTDVLYNATVYRNEAGQVQGVFAAARDVTERKRAEAELAKHRDHLEELVRQRTAQLEAANAELARSNQELEQFAYVASHDLQEPLRAVTGYLGLIEYQLQDKLDDKGRQHIAGAVQGAARMHTLITDLLALSRIGTRGQAFEPADLNDVLDQALDGLRTLMEETGAKVTHDPLPTLRVDAGQIAQLFQNLIGNALKFRGERSPEIHVSVQQQPDQWVLAVRDNGIGIEPRYFERVFLIFQRLHTRKHYPGTGIGLAVCKKIVERHGGTIWVESQSGRGSAFYFSIPTERPHEYAKNYEPGSGQAN